MKKINEMTAVPDKDAKRPIMAVTYWFREEGKTREEDEVKITIFRTEEELGKDPLYTGRKFFEGLGIRGRCTGATARRVEVWQRNDPEPGEMMLEEYIRLRQERETEKTT